jgi:spore coat-associated protein N
VSTSAQWIEGACGPPPRQLIRRPKRTLGALALGLAALGVAVGSGADFSAQTANPSNTFSAGSLSMDNSKNGSAIFAPTNLKPGGHAQTGIVDIKNTGTLDGVFTLRRDQLTNTDGGTSSADPLAAKVNVKIVDCGKFTTADGPYGPNTVSPTCGDPDDSTLYNGTLAGETDDLALGIYRAGERHRYQFAGSLDASAGNDYADDTSSARYVFDAVQTP